MAVRHQLRLLLLLFAAKPDALFNKSHNDHLPALNKAFRGFNFPGIIHRELQHNFIQTISLL